MKLLYHTWFRTGSTYTANGVVEVLKEVQTSLAEIEEPLFYYREKPGSKNSDYIFKLYLTTYIFFF